MLLGCFVVLHSPDGHNLAVNTDGIAMVRDGTHHIDHIAKGTGAILYTAGGKVGVFETQDEVLKTIKGCSK